MNTLRIREQATPAADDWVQSPLGPTQHTQNDNGPPWTDDGEYFPGKHYYEGTPATPVLPASGECSSPLRDSCETRGVLTAHLDGPINCGGAGWFCRLTEQDGFVNPDGLLTDLNFAHCNASDADDRDNDGHCHGSNDDSTYGWWVRDHWFRGYASKMECCCDWGAVQGRSSTGPFYPPIRPSVNPSFLFVRTPFHIFLVQPV
jgi:hypothetical protein